MREESLRTELLARRAHLDQQIDALTAQLRACDIMLAALPPLPSAPPAAPDAQPPSTPASAAAPAVPPVPDDSPQPPPQPPAPSMPAELLTQEMGEQPDGSFARARWGRISIRIEHLIAEAGDPFSVDSIVEAYKTRFHWRGYPTEDSIASSFWRVVRKGGYRVLRKGSGRRATLYTKQKFGPPSGRANNLPGNTPRSTPPPDIGSASPPAASTP